MECPLRKQALLHPDSDFLISSSGVISFRDADELCSRFQTSLVEYGCSSGSRISILLSPSPEAVCFLFACLRQGVVICPLNLRLPEKRLQDMHAFLGSEHFFPELPRLGKDPAETAEVDPDHLATVLFTSGSSGEPKAVQHTLHNHLSAAFSANAFAPLTEDDRWLCSLPLYHVGGLAILFRCVLAGATVVFSESEPVTHLSLVPTQLIRLLREKIPTGLKRILLGGAPVPHRLIEQAQAVGLPLASSYGMTETASQIAATPPGEMPRGAGKVMAHAEVKISEAGEILIRGESVSDACLQSDGWLHTGDVGRLEEGNLYVDGRMDRQFISGGENIQPEQIEQALMGLEGVSQAVVAPEEDEEFGQRPVAWVDADWQREWEQDLRKRLPGYMIPVRFEKLDAGIGLKPDLKQLMKRNS